MQIELCIFVDTFSNNKTVLLQLKYKCMYFSTNTLPNFYFQHSLTWTTNIKRILNLKQKATIEIFLDNLSGEII